MIFHEYAGTRGGYVNLDVEGQVLLKQQGKVLLPKDISPFVSPRGGNKLFHFVHRRLSLAYSFGGWMENRRLLWQGSYLEEKQTFIHLGVDVNAPPGTEISIDFEAHVVLIDDDYPEVGGWGPRVIVKSHDDGDYYIFAHLNREIPVEEGTRIFAGTVFARVGRSPYNGKWFSHVHVQRVRADVYEPHIKRGTLHRIDGYGAEKHIRKLAREFPFPSGVVFI